jgi:hypothetical protein
MIFQLLAGGILGAGAILTLGWWVEHREDRLIEAFLQEEEDTILRMFELMLLGFEDESVTGFIVSSPVEQGVVAMKMIVHEGEQDVIFYARADGFDVSLVSPQEWAAIASYEVVQAIPCVEDFNTEDDWDEDDYEEA